MYDILRQLRGFPGISIGQTEHIIGNHSAVHARVAWDWFSDSHHGLGFSTVALLGLLALVALFGLFVQVEGLVVILRLNPKEVMKNLLGKWSLVLLLFGSDAHHLCDFFILYFI